MALCLAESIIERRGFDAEDQMQRYVRWWTSGHLSSTGRCFDIGNTVRGALERFRRTGEPFAGSTDRSSAGNGSIMRLAPIPIAFFLSGPQALHFCSESSRTTHATPAAVDACRYLGALILGALGGASKEEPLSPMYAPWPGVWSEHPLVPEIEAIARGSFRTKEPPAIRGSGYVVESLEAALWAFHRSDGFREGCLRAVNLGDDADTTAAVFGQMAGAHRGESAIPAEWRAKLARKELLHRYAETLVELAFDRDR
jgi:ADP-ribosyl-[dinitrogen reductase] hydrolase